MTSRADIFPTATKNGPFRRLSYTRRCGWVDWGHAKPSGPGQLKAQMENEKSGFHLLDKLEVTLEGAPAFVVSYGQSMGGMGITISEEAHWIVRKGLPQARRESAALGIFMVASHRFESMQASLPYSLVTDSGYSAEDILSNVIGFYGSFRNISLERLRVICGETSIEESVRIWDEHLPNGLGAIKNRTANPVLFETREGVSSPSDTTFPLMLRTIQPSAAGTDWVPVRPRFIDGRLLGSRLPLDFSRSGEVQRQTAQTARSPAYVR